MAITLRESLSLFKQDIRRSNYSYFRFLYDPVIAQLFSFRIANSRVPIIYLISKIKLKFLSYITGIQIVDGTDIGGGIRVIHHGSVVITRGAKIGRNLTLHQGVTIGKNFGGKRCGYPSIGDNVIIFPNTVVIGKITIGSNVIIGAGSVVINDVPNNCVIAGNPAKIISEDYRKAINDGEWKQYFHLPLQ